MIININYIFLYLLLLSFCKQPKNTCTDCGAIKDAYGDKMKFSFCTGYGESVIINNKEYSELYLGFEDADLFGYIRQVKDTIYFKKANDKNEEEQLFLILSTLENDSEYFKSGHDFLRYVKITTLSFTDNTWKFKVRQVIDPIPHMLFIDSFEIDKELNIVSITFNRRQYKSKEKLKCVFEK